MHAQSRLVVTDVPSVEVAELGLIPEALAGEPREYAQRVWSAADEAVRTGVWACDAGTFPGKHPDLEIAYILSGRVTFVSSDGEEADAGPGSLVVFPPGWTGTWQVHEPVRKVYVIAKAD